MPSRELAGERINLGATVPDDLTRSRSRLAGPPGPGPLGSFSHPASASADDRASWGAQSGQVCLAYTFDRLPDGSEPVVPGGGERTPRPRPRPRSGRPTGRSTL